MIVAYPVVAMVWFKPVKNVIDTAAALCVSTRTCSTMDEFQARMDEVSAECCDEPTEDCSSGFPASCNAGCASVLLPMQVTISQTRKH